MGKVKENYPEYCELKACIEDRITVIRSLEWEISAATASATAAAAAATWTYYYYYPDKRVQVGQLNRRRQYIEHLKVVLRETQEDLTRLEIKMQSFITGRLK